MSSLPVNLSCFEKGLFFISDDVILFFRVKWQLINVIEFVNQTGSSEICSLVNCRNLKFYFLAIYLISSIQ